MKNKTKFSLFTILVIFIFSACDIAENINPTSEFTKILSSQDLDEKIYPIDIQETSNGDFIVLSSVYNNKNTYVWHSPQISKIDNLGNILWQTNVESPLVNPVGELINISDEYYFFCMNETSLVANLLKINQLNGETETVATFTDITYPLSAYLSADNHILIQGYNHLARKTIFAKIDNSYQLSWLKEYLLVEDAEEMIISHIIKTGNQFPFAIGEFSDGNYYINGFYNYSFSTLFINSSSGNILGLINGYRYEGAVSSFTSMGDNMFAISIYNQDNNYLLLNQEISSSNTYSIEGFDGVYMPQLQTNAKVLSISTTINSKEILILASTTKTNQVVIYYYDKMSKELIATEDISDNNPIELEKIHLTSDNSIIIIGKTFVNGSFSRVFISKTMLPELE